MGLGYAWFHYGGYDTAVCFQATSFWTWLLEKLPNGIYQILIDAYMVGSASSGLLLDDIYIQNCSNFCEYV